MRKSFLSSDEETQAAASSAIIHLHGEPNVSATAETQALATSQMNLVERAINASNSSIVITDPNLPDNPIIYASPGFERQTGYASEEALGRNCRFLQNDDREQAALVELRAAIREVRSTSVVLRNYRKDGTLFYNELNLSPVFDPTGHLTNFIGIQTDVSARIAAEEARQQSEALFHTIVQSFPNGAVTLFDHNLRYFFAEGTSFSENFRREDVEGKTLWEVFPPESSAVLEPNFRAALEGQANTFELKFRNIYFLIHTAPLRNSQNQIYAGIVVVQDINDLKQAQVEKEEVHSQLTSTLESITDGFFILDQDWCFNYVNPEAERMIGRSRQELLGKSIWEFLPDSNGNLFYEMYRRVMKEKIPIHFEAYSQRSIWLEVKAYPTKNNTLSIYFREITERKKAEEQLRHSEQRFRALIEHTDEMITMIGVNGTVLYQSPSVATVMGYTEEELAGRNSFEFVHPDDIVGLITRHKLLLTRPGGVYQNEFRFKHKDGSWHYIESISQNLLEVPGINAIIVNGHDVTARKKIELALRQSEEMLNFALDAAQVGTWDYDIPTRVLLKLIQNWLIPKTATIWLKQPKRRLITKPITTSNIEL